MKNIGYTAFLSFLNTNMYGQIRASISFAVFSTKRSVAICTTSSMGIFRLPPESIGRALSPSPLCLHWEQPLEQALAECCHNRTCFSRGSCPEGLLHFS